MRLLALLVLSLAVVMHHGVPGAGHAAHAADTVPCDGASCASGVPDGHDDDHGAGIAASCLAIVAMAAVAGLSGPAPLRIRALVAHARRVAPPAGVLMPMAHGPPRPLRPCVLQR